MRGDMSSDYIIYALVFTLVAVQVMHWLEARSWRAERRELCSRLQAGTLREYAAVQPVERSRLERPDERRREIEEDMGADLYQQEVPEGMLVMARDAHDRLMSARRVE